MHAGGANPTVGRAETRDRRFADRDLRGPEALPPAPRVQRVDTRGPPLPPEMRPLIQAWGGPGQRARAGTPSAADAAIGDIVDVEPIHESSKSEPRRDHDSWVRAVQKYRVSAIADAGYVEPEEVKPEEMKPDLSRVRSDRRPGTEPPAARPPAVRPGAYGTTGYAEPEEA